MKILFTPVGGTDPISENTLRDGAMLHIARVYKPDKVIMYMSKEMIDRQEMDGRYTYCLEKLGEFLGKSFEYEIIKRPELVNVHIFNDFYDDFENIIKDIYSTMGENDELLANVSSGTPAMKSTLMVLKTILELPCRLIQVATPSGRMNEHTHTENVKELWELDEDNCENFIDRCSEIACPSLHKIKYREIIKQHVRSYDYQAAVTVADLLPLSDTKDYIKQLKLAAARLMLDHYEVDRIQKDISVDFLPHKNDDVRKYFEYALNLDIKLQKKEYADFVRAITPIIFDLFALALKEKCKVDIFEYCKQSNNGVYKWDRNKLLSSDTGKRINECLNKKWSSHNGHGFKYDVPYAVHIKEIAGEFSNDKEFLKLLKNLRKVEGGVRNLAAHEIISINDKFIISKTGFTSDQIMDMIKELFRYTGIAIKRADWNSYDDMNRAICDTIDKVYE